MKGIAISFSQISLLSVVSKDFSNLWQSVLCFVTSNFYFFQEFVLIK